MTLTTTFWSSDGDRIYTVECIGEPVHTLTCTCKGYENLQCCKHLDAVIAGSDMVAIPTPIDGYNEARQALDQSRVRGEYLQMLNELLQLDQAKAQLNKDAKAVRKSFYKRLAQGIK